MNTKTTDLLLEEMLSARGVTLRAGGVLAGLLFAGFLHDQIGLLTERGELVLIAVILIALVVILMGLLVTCYYLFRVGLREAGLRYAIGHVLLCIGLAGMFLIGVIAIPRLVRGDIERWRRSEGELADVLGSGSTPSS